MHLYKKIRANPLNPCHPRSILKNIRGTKFFTKNTIENCLRGKVARLCVLQNGFYPELCVLREKLGSLCVLNIKNVFPTGVFSNLAGLKFNLADNS